MGCHKDFKNENIVLSAQGKGPNDFLAAKEKIQNCPKGRETVIIFYTLTDAFNKSLASVS